MSSIHRSEKLLMQRIGNRTDELGYIDWDPNSESCVLWLKDTCGVLGLRGGYIRGESFESEQYAMDNAMSSPSASVMHFLWIRFAVKEEIDDAISENWDEISSELSGNIQRKFVRDKVAEYLNGVSVDELKKWGKKIRDGVVVSAIIELTKRILDSL